MESSLVNHHRLVTTSKKTHEAFCMTAWVAKIPMLADQVTAQRHRVGRLGGIASLLVHMLG